MFLASNSSTTNTILKYPTLLALPLSLNMINPVAILFIIRVKAFVNGEVLI